MINRSVHMIFEPSGQPIPSEEEVQFEAQEIVNRSGWGLPLIEALRKVRDPYWREAVTRCLMELWQDLVRDKDEQTYYYDSDGDVRYCWMDAEYDFGRINKARALVEEVRQWQKMGYIDSNYNARVMYDELNKIIILPFQYDGFRKYYNE